jgi:hypothetical protein
MSTFNQHSKDHRSKSSKLDREPTKKVNVVSLSFLSPPVSTVATFVGEVIEALKNHWPEFLPTTFGTGTGLQKVISGRDLTILSKEAAKLDSTPRWSVLYFEPDDHSMGAQVALSDTHESTRIGIRGRLPMLTLWIGDERWFYSESMREESIGRFLSLARSLRSFYAAAYVKRDGILSRGELSFDPEDNRDTFRTDENWKGLPTSPPWLSWYGIPYRKTLLATFAQTEARVYEDGIFFKCGQEPHHAAALVDKFPKFPQDLLERRVQGSKSGTWLTLPAEHIPSLNA